MQNKSKLSKRAVVLLSGGLDSAVALYLAKSKGYQCFALIFDYGQRHKKEINAAKKIAFRAGCFFKVLKIILPWGGSSLLDKQLALPKQLTQGIPSTYVPARNIIFLSFAASFAETIKAKAIFIGAHVQDYSGYPDCRPDFFRVFSEVIQKGTKSGAAKQAIKIETPVIYKAKAEIIRLGIKLGVPLSLTWSCYKGGRKPCGVCDSCRYRARGFVKAGLGDPAFPKKTMINTTGKNGEKYWKGRAG